MNDELECQILDSAIANKVVGYKLTPTKADWDAYNKFRAHIRQQIENDKWRQLYATSLHRMPTL